MKTTIKSTIALVALALLSTGVFAQEQPATDSLTATASVSYMDNTCGIEFTIDNAEAGQTMISVYDAEGNEVLSDSFDTNNVTVSKDYLMTELPDGDYTVAVCSKNEVKATVITLKNDDDSSEDVYSL